MGCSAGMRRRHAAQTRRCTIVSFGGASAASSAEYCCAGRRRSAAGTHHGSKFHAACDGQGRPIVLLLSEDQVSKHKGAHLIVDALPSASLIADRGYDSDWLSAELFTETQTQTSSPALVLTVVAGVLLITSITGSCSIYYLLGLSSCPINDSGDT